MTALPIDPAAEAAGHATAVSDYAARRTRQLLGLLEDVESWRALHRHALEQSRQHPVGSEARIVLGRLAQAAADVVVLAEAAPDPDPMED